jgi:hypothetical protein
MTIAYTSQSLSRSQIAIFAEIPQEPTEPDPAYLALVEWVQCGLPPLADVARTTRSDPTQVRRWHEVWRWQERLDRSAYAVPARLWAERLLQVGDDLAEHVDASQLATGLLKRTLTRIAVQDALGDAYIHTTAHARDLAYTAKTMLEVERLQRGQSTHNVSVQGTVSVDRARLADLTEAQLEALAALGLSAGGELDEP